MSKSKRNKHRTGFPLKSRDRDIFPELAFDPRGRYKTPVSTEKLLPGGRNLIKTDHCKVTRG